MYCEIVIPSGSKTTGWDFNFHKKSKKWREKQIRSERCYFVKSNTQRHSFSIFRLTNGICVLQCIYFVGRMDFQYTWAVYLLFHMHFTQILHTISISLTVVLALWRYIAIK